MNFFLYTLCFFSILISCSASELLGLKIPSEDQVLDHMNHNTLKKHLDAENFSIVVWNLYKGKNDSWKEDFIKLNKSDLFLFQEFYMSEKMTQTFSHDEEKNYSMATSFLYEKENIATGVGIAYSVPLLSLEFLKSKNKEPVISTPKMAIYTKHPLSNGQTLSVVNIHSLNFVTNKVFKNQIKDIISNVDLKLGPFIFAGDFNTNTKGKEKFIKTYLKSLGFHSISFSPDERMKFNGHILDYVFIKDLEAINSKTWGKLKGSDHTAMKVTLKTR